MASSKMATWKETPLPKGPSKMATHLTHCLSPHQLSTPTATATSFALNSSSMGMELEPGLTSLSSWW